MMGYYDMGLRFWGIDWGGCDWSYDGKGCDEFGFFWADENYRAPWFGLKPDSSAMQTIIVTVDGSPTKYVIGPSDFENKIPVIPTFKQEQQKIYNKNGKEIAHGLSKVVVDVKNITAEYDSVGNLIVQWAEPIIAKPGVELKLQVMAIGDDFDLSNPPESRYASIFTDPLLWIDCPSQLGTVVVPAEMMNKLKARHPGLSRGVVRIIYRDRQKPNIYVNDNPEPAGSITTRNRGLSAFVEFAL
jgi:hypothetical protein